MVKFSVNKNKVPGPVFSLFLLLSPDHAFFSSFEFSLFSKQRTEVGNKEDVAGTAFISLSHLLFCFCWFSCFSSFESQLKWCVSSSQRYIKEEKERPPLCSPFKQNEASCNFCFFFFEN